MKPQNVLCLWALFVSITCGANAAQTVVKTESFNTKASASTNGWVEHLSRQNANNYGFSDSDHNGAGAGEAGGALTRTSAARSYYADVFGGRLSADDRFTARGKLTLATALSDNRIHVGHLDSALDTVTAKNLVGLFVQEPTRIHAAIGLADGTFVTPLVGMAEPGVIYNWDYTYDPNGGPTGTGELTVNVEGLGSAVVTLIAFQRAIGFSVDAFGISNPGAGSSATDAGAMYIDNVEYTAVLAPLKVTGIELMPAGNIRVTFNSPAPAQTHAVQETPNLAPPTWTDVVGVSFTPLAGNVITAEIPRPANAPRFYRVVLRP